MAKALSLAQMRKPFSLKFSCDAVLCDLGLKFLTAVTSESRNSCFRFHVGRLTGRCPGTHGDKGRAGCTLSADGVLLCDPLARTPHHSQPARTPGRQGERPAVQEREGEAQPCNAPAALKQEVMPPHQPCVMWLANLKLREREGLHRAPQLPTEVLALRLHRGGSGCIQGIWIETKLETANLNKKSGKG